MADVNQFWLANKLVDPELTLRQAQKLWDTQAFNIHSLDNTNEILVLLDSAVDKIKEIRSQVSVQIIQANEENIFFQRVEDVEFLFSARTLNSFQRMQIVYVGDLVQKTETGLLREMGFGKKSLTEVKNFLSEHGLQLSMTLPEWCGVKS